MDKAPARQVLDLMIGYWASQSIYVAAKLKIPEHLAEGGKTSHDLANVTGTHQPSLLQILRFLAGLGIVEGDDETGFSLTSAGDLLAENAPNSLRDLVIIYGEEFYQAWGNLLHNVQTGQPAFERTFGDSMYSYFSANPESSRKFDGAMSGGSFFAELPGVVDFSDAGKIVDVAGGTGGLLHTILESNKQAEGILFDLGHVIDHAKKASWAPDVIDRVSFVVGNYREAVPAGGDVYLLSRILHSLPEDSCVNLLKRCHEAMSPQGKIIVIERLIPPTGTNSLGLWFDVQMMVAIGGKERDERQYRDMFERAGLTLESVRPLPLDMSALVVSQP